MKITEVLGIDVSKLTLDCYAHCSGVYQRIDNSGEAIATMVEWAVESSGVVKENLLFVFEHTGMYSDLLKNYLSEHGFLFHIAPGLAIKNSLGIVRGKDDKIDAKRIALYGYRLREELQPSQVPSKTLQSLKRLIAFRRKLVRQRAAHKTTLGEQSSTYKDQLEEVIRQGSNAIIRELDHQVAKVEQNIQELIQEDPKLKEIHSLLLTINGIGEVTARFLIVYTLGFTAFKSWRKFASYCGIAPFPHKSGSSTNRKDKVSHLANKEGKALLNLCATSAIQSNPEMRMYYHKRIENGKNKMSTINIIRNKLLARAFAVVQRKTPYVETMKFAS